MKIAFIRKRLCQIEQRHGVHALQINRSFAHLDLVDRSEDIVNCQRNLLGRHKFLVGFFGFQQKLFGLRVVASIRPQSPQLIQSEYVSANRRRM